MSRIAWCHMWEDPLLHIHTHTQTCMCTHTALGLRTQKKFLRELRSTAQRSQGALARHSIMKKEPLRMVVSGTHKNESQTWEDAPQFLLPHCMCLPPGTSVGPHSFSPDITTSLVSCTYFSVFVILRLKSPKRTPPYQINWKFTIQGAQKGLSKWKPKYWKTLI